MIPIWSSYIALHPYHNRHPRGGSQQAYHLPQSEPGALSNGTARLNYTSIHFLCYQDIPSRGVG